MLQARAEEAGGFLEGFGRDQWDLSHEEKEGKRLKINTWAGVDTHSDGDTGQWTGHRLRI